MIKKKKILFIGAGCALLLFAAGLIVFLLWQNGSIKLNRPKKEEYPVKGVDVSSYQGEIDWDVLADEKIEFAFIKATEGSTFQDQKFDDNWERAFQTDLKVGAYHFFSYDSPGKTQAENFIRTVPAKEGMLPPVIDIEFYGDKKENLPPQDEAHQILGELIEALESHYGQRPIIYATEKSFELYIENAYDDYPIWIRNVASAPNKPEDGKWTFWQYTDKEKLKGYHGKEPCIDMNVFYGSKKEFDDFCRTSLRTG